MRPVWRGGSAPPYAFFCPNCKAERRVRNHPTPGQPVHYIRIALLTAVFTIALWSFFGAKGLVSFVPFWAAFEVVYRLRSRADLTCPYCGFDPFLYLADVQRARAGVEAHWRKVFADKGIPYPGTPSVSPPAPAANAEQGSAAPESTRER